MIELLADPTSALLWVVFLMALGMYPFGLMLGSPCSPCCGKCPCTEGELPETVTVTIDGYSDKSQSQVHLSVLRFDACYGSGAAGHVTAPGGDPATDAGPVSAVTLSSPGSGYAKLGRTAPTVTATGSGSGATFDVTLTQSLDDCDVDEWKVTKVAVTAPGSGYVHDEALTFTVAAGDTQEVAAVARLQTERGEPAATLEVTSAQGSGAAFTVVFSSIGGTPPVWGVDSVTVDDGGDLYVTGDPVTFTKSPTTTEVLQAAFTAKATHTLPTVSAYVDSATGTGAALSVTLSAITQDDGSAAWEVSAVAIDNAGSGYGAYDSVAFDVTDGISTLGASAYVDSVDASGAVQSITVDNAGVFFKGGPISEIVVDAGGSYFGDTGEAESVEIDNGGAYYREDATLPPYVAEVTVTIDQIPPSDGNGAEITATVNDDANSVHFGEIESISINSGGTGYLAWEWVANNCCGHYLNGKTFVLKRDNIPHLSADGAIVNFANFGAPKYVPHECVYSHRVCGGWYSPFATGPYWLRDISYKTHNILVGYRGHYAPPIAAVARLDQSYSPDDYPSSGCAEVFETDTLISDCDNFDFSATSEHGQTITVSAGGNYDATNGIPDNNSCSACCQGTAPLPQEITVALIDYRVGANIQNLSGNYVLGYDNLHRWRIYNPIALEVRVEAELCAKNPAGGGCDHCLKKCAVVGSMFFPDARFCGADDAAKCAVACIDSPVCAPPAGVELFWKTDGGCGNPVMKITTI